MCFVVWEQTVTYSIYIKKRIVFITEIKSVYSAVRTGPLNKAVCASSLRDVTVSQNSSPYTIDAILYCYTQLYTDVKINVRGNVRINVTLRSVHVTTVVEEQQHALHIMNVCLYSCHSFPMRK
jgi:ABC-type molybdate transport system ATPase subunit